MFVFVCLRVCVCGHACDYLIVHVCTLVCTSVHVYASVCVLCVRECVCVREHARVFVCTRTRVCRQTDKQKQFTKDMLQLAVEQI